MLLRWHLFQIQLEHRCILLFSWMHESQGTNHFKPETKHKRNIENTEVQRKWANCHKTLSSPWTCPTVVQRTESPLWSHYDLESPLWSGAEMPGSVTHWPLATGMTRATRMPSPAILKKTQIGYRRPTLRRHANRRRSEEEKKKKIVFRVDQKYNQ